MVGGEKFNKCCRNYRLVRKVAPVDATPGVIRRS